MVSEMFGMGGTEIIVILIVALLFLGPDKLPEAARQISKGIRDIKKQSRVLQRTIEDDEHIGGAIRDLKSALRGEDEPIRPKPIKPVALPEGASATHAAIVAAAGHDTADVPVEHNILGHGDDAIGDVYAPADATPGAGPSDDRPKLTLPATAGNPDLDAPNAHGGDADDDHVALAALVKQAPHTIPRNTPSGPLKPEASNTGDSRDARASDADPAASSAPNAPIVPSGNDKSEPTHG
jgi:sec-independent protein translocase protein TatB